MFCVVLSANVSVSFVVIFTMVLLEKNVLAPTLINVKFDPTSKAADPLEENNFPSGKLIEAHQHQ